MTRRIRDKRAPATLALLLLTACGAIDPGEQIFDGEETELSQGLYGNKNYYWSGNPPMIPVCWENPSNNTISGTGFTITEATSRGWVRDAVEGQWARYGRVNFTQWDTCTAGEPGVHIRINTTGGSSAPGGNLLNGVDNGVNLNLYYNDRPGDCQNSLANLQRCVQAVALHEFGHVLGFYHEEERPDYAGGTGTGCAKQSWPNANPQYYGAYDVDSVMSYCGQPGNDPSTWKMALSAGDIASVQKAYGRRRPGQMVGARGADMLANNISPDNRSFIWDADEAAGQLWTYNWARQAFEVSTNGTTACLDTYPGASSGKTLITSHCFYDSFERFPLDDVNVRGFGGLCLDVPGGQTANGTPLQMWKCLGNGNQRWRIDAGQHIKFGTTNKCVTWNATLGESLFLWDCGAAPYAAQQTFAFAADGALTFNPGAPEFDLTQCVDVQGPTSTQYLSGIGLPGNGSRVQTWTCLADQLNQKWNLSGAFKHESGYCVDVANANNANGTPVQTYACNGTVAQQWDYYWK